MIASNDLHQPSDKPRYVRRLALRLSSAAMMLTGGATAAHAQTQKIMVDVIGSAGISSSPFLSDEGSSSSATFGLSILPRYSLIDERGTFSVEGNYRRTQYLRRYGSTDGYGVSASASRRLTEKVDGNAFVSFDSSILGERGRREIFEPSAPILDGVTPAPLPNPVGVDFIIPDLIVDVGLIGLRQRQTQLTAGAGLGYSLSEIDRISGQVSASRISYGGGFPLADYQTYSGSLAYSRSLSEFTQVGARVTTQQTNYDTLPSNGSPLLNGARFSNSSVYQPQLTIDTRFSPLWSLSAAAGLLFIRSDEVTGSGNSTGLSGSVDASRRGERSNLSLRAFRDASASGLGGVSRTIGASVAYSRQLNQTDSVSGSANYSRSNQNDLFAQSGLPVQDGFIGRNRNFSFASLEAGYERRLSDRLNAGVSASYRDTFDSLGGRPADLSGQLFIRARLGDLR